MTDKQDNIIFSFFVRSQSNEEDAACRTTPGEASLTSTFTRFHFIASKLIFLHHTLK